jgi:two-component sensor histidine kinase
MTIIIFLRLNIGRRKRAGEELRNALREKDFILQELNHRVKNNLAIISSLIGLKNSAFRLLPGGMNI